MSVTFVMNEIADRDIAVLNVTGDLDFLARADFQAALAKLGSSGQSKLVIDISKLSRLSSLYIGSLIDFGNSVQQSGKSLSVMMPGAFVRACEGVGLDAVATIIKVKG